MKFDFPQKFEGATQWLGKLNKLISVNKCPRRSDCRVRRERAAMLDKWMQTDITGDDVIFDGELEDVLMAWRTSLF